MCSSDLVPPALPMSVQRAPKFREEVVRRNVRECVAYIEGRTGGYGFVVAKVESRLESLRVIVARVGAISAPFCFKIMM